MRAIGYSLSAAVADLVDNSVTAGSSRISIDFHWDGWESWIRVSDDGHGMSAGDLTAAMRLGSTSPLEHRDPEDLGRFGLGLKTAALSQGSVVTVASSDGGGQEVRSWDLEHVSATGSWSLLCEPAPADGPAMADGGADAGTRVLIRRLDRLIGIAETDDEAAKDRFLQQVDQVREHLGMVFHRFISSELEILVNGHAVAGWDPFLEAHPATQRLAEECPSFAGERVRIQPFVLPHFSNLSPEAHAAGAGPRGWNFHQGFYVYRARRLLVAGDWLGLPFQKEEHFKLARIRVDITNAMDHDWQIDVRKAVARIPRRLRGEFRRIADATRRRASDAYRYRGKRIARTVNADRSFVWQSVVNRGARRHRIDRRHALLAADLEALGEDRAIGERMLRLVEETVPVQAIMIDHREDPDVVVEPFVGRTAEVERRLREALEAMVSAGAEPGAALRTLAAIEPFNAHPELIAAFDEGAG